ncbi:uncharacterized protein BT62DRAFT_947185 [Guyanagaster necrorhizus]|uniref:CSN8/PSMD8/EIF3K domain-containing protein n=1 Tax=Guyanagaster necrorhizus TaxID=856835 RepID=A0A9P7VYL3_9AGAR|nr:uncharacterized protein BT62DRAFT_947185 [Guyanagaster necrorhizus MCA 3950]KAG7448211.1 hypothetical protein BT62DRAFT_947185 [Guyanagaster necrorhizus MCA 3950]
MANGPPTPPPTTDIEIQDAAREEASANANAQATSSETETETDPEPAERQLPSRSPPSQDVFQQAFQKIASLSSEKQWHELISVAEDADVWGDDESPVSRLLVVAPLVLGYLIIDDLPAARFALTRIHPRLQKLPISTALASLLESSMERKHKEVYARAEVLYNMAKDTGSAPDPKFPGVLSEMVQAFTESFRERTFRLLSKAYAALPLALAQTYLGLTSDRLLAAAESNNWKYNASTQVLSPTVSSGPQGTSLSASSSLAIFGFIADSVAEVEIM